MRGGGSSCFEIDFEVCPDTDCWEWQRARTTGGYAEAWDGERVVYAHRVYYEACRGPIPDGLHIDHLCRNRACVNPDHMEVVTCGENIRRGAAAKLDWDKVRAIRASVGVSPLDLASSFGISRRRIYDVLADKAWVEGT